jgi:hypothetical protein
MAEEQNQVISENSKIGLNLAKRISEQGFTVILLLVALLWFNKKYSELLDEHIKMLTDNQERLIKVVDRNTTALEQLNYFYKEK